MDKVGIITLMHVRNIGAVLQAYATKCIIEEAGFEPIFIRAYGIGDAILVIWECPRYIIWNLW